MSANNLDRRLGIDSIATKMNDMEKTLREMRTTQTQGGDSLNLDKSAGVVISWSLLNNQRGVGSYTLANSEGKMLFAVPEFTFYEGSIALGNEIGYGHPRDANYQWNSWIDWGSSDGNNMVLACYIVNNSGSSKIIESVCAWRFVVSPSSYNAIT